MHRSLSAVVTLLVSAALALSIGPASPSPAAAQAAMVATGVTPNYGPSSGGTLVTITGTGFGSDTGFALIVGQTNAYAYTDVSCTSSTTCTARTPAAPIVQRGDAQQAQTVGSMQTAPPASNPFTVYGPTSLEGLIPAYGPATGGTRVTLFGGMFPDGSTLPGPVPQVFFETTPATDVSCSATGAGNFCEATAPAWDNPLPATVPVTIVSVGGTSPQVAFTYYPPPQATATSPNYAPSTGGTAVTITGENFAPDQQFQAMAGVTPGGPMFTNVNCTSPTTCTATTPAIPMGPGATQPIGVFAIGQVLPGEISIQYYGVPVLQSIGPPSGAAGATVTLKGGAFPNNPPNGLPGPTSFRFGAAEASNVHCTDDSTCTATVPPGSGTVQVTVMTPGGVSNGLPFAYASSSGIPTLPGLPSLPNLPALPTLPALPALPSIPGIPSLPGSTAPTVTSVTTNYGPYAGGTAVTITGVNFPANQAQLGFAFNSGEQFTDVSCTSSTTCIARTPAVPVPPTGWGILNVQTVQQTTVAGPGFTVYTAPQLQSISPTSGPATGGTVVTLTGGAFPNGTSYLLGPAPEVSFGSRPATNVRCTARDGTSCTAVVPPGSGTVQVTVTTPGGTSGSLPFTYTASTGLPGTPSLPLPVPSIPTIPQIPVPGLPPIQNP